jgi:flagellar P-ring protein precursor FlgI
LRGGELLMTELRGADNQVYAVAQGSVVVSGFGAQGSDGSKVTVNSTASGRIPNGATVETILEPPFVNNGIVIFELLQPDFSAAEMIANAINVNFKQNIAKPIDASSVKVNLQSHVRPVYPTIVNSYKDEALNGPRELQPKNNGDYVKYIARIENIAVTPQNGRAKIIVNSRTGTIVIDEHVIISSVAVSHGNLSVVVSEKPFVSQPNAFANGRTVKGSASDISINQAPSRTFLLETGTSLRELVDEINRVGAAPGDIISILEAIKAAGALHAELEII